MLLKRIYKAETGLTLEMRAAMSREILDDFDRGALDAAIILRHDPPPRWRGYLCTFEEAFGLMAAPDFEHQPGEPLRLATRGRTMQRARHRACGAREAGIPWTEVFVGGGIPTIGAAASAGLAVAALGRRVAPPGTEDVAPQLGLPPLPSRDVVLYSDLTHRLGVFAPNPRGGDPVHRHAAVAAHNEAPGWRLFCRKDSLTSALPLWRLTVL